MIRPWPKRFQYPFHLLSIEPETDKALRLLRGMRHWVGLKTATVSCIELDGQKILLIKYSPERHPNADTATEAEL